MPDGNETRPDHNEQRELVPDRENAPRHGSQPGAGYPSRYTPDYMATYGLEDPSAIRPGAWTLASVINSIWLKKKTVIYVLLFALVSAAYYLVVATRIYEARSQIELSLRRPRIMNQQDAVVNDTDRISTMEVFNSQLLKLRGPTLRSQVQEKARKWFSASGLSDTETRKWLEKNVSIDLLARSSLVRFSVRSPDPQQAVAVANMYAEAGIAHAMEINREKSTNAVVWLQAQIETQRRELEKTEETLLDFRRRNPLDTLESQRDTGKEALLAFSKALTEALAKKDELLSRYMAKHPEVLAQDEMIAAARSQYEGQVKRNEELEIRIAQVRTRLNALERERDASEMTFKGILRRMEEARLSADENTTIMQVTEKAELPETPVWPRPIPVLVLAILIGLGGGCAMALVSTKLEDRVWHLSDITTFMGLRLLGLIPHAGEEARERLALKSHEDKFSLFAEAYAAVRGMIDSSFKGKVFMVTSALPEEGKTVSAVNLATAWAKTGNRVLLVDLDMRRPRLHRIFNIPAASRNLLEALATKGDSDFSGLPSATLMENLSVIVSRVEEDLSPAEVLGSQRIRSFIRWASENYDRVVIDSPPVSAASESLVVGSMVDGVVLVCRFNKSQKSITKSAAFRLQDAGAFIVGVVINDAKEDLRTLSGQFGAYYGSHYSNAGRTDKT